MSQSRASPSTAMCSVHAVLQLCVHCTPFFSHMFIPRHSTSVYVSRISITACSIHTILQLGLFIPRHYTAIPRHYTAANFVFIPRHSRAVCIPHHDIAGSYVFIPRHSRAVCIPHHYVAGSYVFIPRHSRAVCIPHLQLAMCSFHGISKLRIHSTPFYSYAAFRVFLHVYTCSCC